MWSSDREVRALSLDVFVADLEAVVDGIGLGRFPLLGMPMGAPVAVACSAQHPERGSRLVIHGGFHRSYHSSTNPDPRVLEEADVLFRSARLGWGTGKWVGGIHSILPDLTFTIEVAPITVSGG